MNELSLRMIEAVAQGLDDLNENVAFVGGAVAGLYADDPASEDARPTMDVDCVLQLGTMKDLYALEETLRIRHFQHDTESGIICRWIYKKWVQDIVVDIMPTDEHILGFSNRWYAKGMANKRKHLLPNGYTIHIFPVTYYLATKLEAIASRGGNDLRQSHDFEDFIYVLNGCTTIKKDLCTISDEELRFYLTDKFQTLRKNANIEECIECVLPYGEEERCEYILSLLEIFSK